MIITNYKLFESWWKDDEQKVPPPRIGKSENPPTPPKPMEVKEDDDIGDWIINKLETDPDASKLEIKGYGLSRSYEYVFVNKKSTIPNENDPYGEENWNEEDNINLLITGEGEERSTYISMNNQHLLISKEKIKRIISLLTELSERKRREIEEQRIRDIRERKARLRQKLF
jgi:hypothetical protein